MHQPNTSDVPTTYYVVCPVVPGSETKIKVNNSIFWDISPCSPLKINRRFERTRRLHLQDRRISRARNQSENRWQALFADLARLIL
jgi:hypothetical protein